MTKPEDGSWDDVTPDDEDARLDGDDHPTIQANDEHVAALRRERMKQRLVDEAANAERKRSTVPGPNKTRAPAQVAMTIPRTVTDRGVPVQPDPTAAIRDAEAANPAITNRGIPVAPILQDLAADAQIEPPGRQSASEWSAPPPPRATPVPMPTRGKPNTGDVILLDRVSGNAPVGDEPRRGEAAAGGVVIVATGMDADRIRRLCHANNLLVPLVSSLAIAHEAMHVVVIGEPSPPAPERVIHVVRPAMTDEQLLELLRALVSGYVVAEPPVSSSDADPRVHEFAARLSKMEDRGAFEMIAVEAVTKLMGADRAHCMFFDPVTGALWSEGVRRTLGDARRAFAGFVGYSAYTGRAIHAEPAGEDSRYLQELDDPEGKPQSRIVVQPIVGKDRRTHAVLVAARRWRHLPFAADDVAQLRNLAALVGPSLSVLASGPDRKPKTTIPGALKNAETASLVEPRKRPPSPPPPPPTRSSQALIDAPTAPRKPIDPAAVQDNEAGDSRKLRATKQPPATSTTGRTKVPTGETRPGTQPGGTNPGRTKQPTDETRPEGFTPSAELPRGAVRPGGTPSGGLRASTSAGVRAPTSSGARSTPSSGAREVPASSSDEFSSTPPSGSRLPLPAPRHPPSSPPTPAAKIAMVHRVAIVAGEEEHDRARRIAKSMGLDIPLTMTTDDAPADTRIITLGLPWSPELDPRVVYVARTLISNDHLSDLLAAVASGKALAHAESALKPQNATEAMRVQTAFNGSRTFASAIDFVSAEAHAIATTRELLDADRAYFLLYDHATGALSSPSRKIKQGDNRRSIAGMAGWVALTGRGAMTERATTDSRWLGPIDDPDGDSNSQLLVQPVVRDQRVTAIIVAAKRPRRPGFTDLDIALAAHYAGLLAPLLAQLQQHIETAKLIDTGTVPRQAGSLISRFVAGIKRLFGRR